MRHWLAVAGALLAVPAAAKPIGMSETEQLAPAVPPILSARERAETENRILAERLDTVIPAIMRAEGIDLWLLVAREYFEEPVVASMLDAENMHARRRTILIFHDPGEGKLVERLTVSRYSLGGLFQPAWDPAKQPDQWQAVADINVAREPAQLPITASDLPHFAEGMAERQHDQSPAPRPAALHAHLPRRATLPPPPGLATPPRPAATTVSSSAAYDVYMGKGGGWNNVRNA